MPLRVITLVYLPMVRPVPVKVIQSSVTVRTKVSSQEHVRKFSEEFRRKKQILRIIFNMKLLSV